MHIDEAPWIRGKPRPQDGPMEWGNQLIGDLKKGPWIHINSLVPNKVSPSHCHTEDEVIFIVEGSLTITGDRACGPGTVIFMEKDTEYGFTVGKDGVRFLNVRPGLADVTRDGVTNDDWEDLIGKRGPATS